LNQSSTTISRRRSLVSVPYCSRYNRILVLGGQSLSASCPRRWRSPCPGRTATTAALAASISAGKWSARSTVLPHGRAPWGYTIFWRPMLQPGPTAPKVHGTQGELDSMFTLYSPPAIRVPPFCQSISSGCRLALQCPAPHTAPSQRRPHPAPAPPCILPARY